MKRVARKMLIIMEMEIKERAIDRRAVSGASVISVQDGRLTLHNFSANLE